VTTTTTFTVTMGSAGVSKAAVGGIAGGIVGGFCLVGALAFFFVSRGRMRSQSEGPPADRGYGVEQQNNENKREGGGQRQFGNINDEPVGGRTII
jgi:hypothetical protein